jgi:diadenosine tetraphosphate (Ap4A) HIT family hydrolase
MDCGFCAEFARPGGGDRIITQDGEWVLLPTLGCFVAGYCLLLPIDHLQAAADLPTDALEALEARIEHLRRQIAGQFGPTIVAEHGPGACDLGASCCTHAHLHLIPIHDIDAVTDAYRQTGGAPRVLEGLAGLHALAGRPYLYLSPEPGTHLAWPAAAFPRQFVRRVCAAILGIPDRYDWRDHPFEATMRTTLLRLRTTFQPQLAPAPSSSA